MNPLQNLPRVAAVVLTLTLICFSPRPGAAQDVLWEDDFSAVDSSFDSSDKTKFTAENNTLTMSSQGTWSYSAFYQSDLFNDIDFTVRVRLGDPDAEKGAYIGIGFWAASYQEYYLLAISDSGTVAVLSTNGKRALYPLPWKQTDALKTGAEEWNDLRVVTVGNWATAYLNGKKLVSFRGKPPEGGSFLGPFYSAGSEESAGHFQSLKVVAPSGADAVAPKDETDPNVLVVDDFSTLDPAWGVESGKLYVKDKTLHIKPDLGFGSRNFYQSAVATDIEATVQVKVSDGDPQSYSSAGLVFWGTTYDDYFIFCVSDDGLVGASRLKGKRWLSPLAYKEPPPEANFKADGFNELKVVTSGKKATLYVNGVAVGTISNPQAQGEWQFGLYAASGKTQSTGEYQSLSVRKPGTK